MTSSHPSKRDQLVAAQRRAGNGSVEDLAAFVGKSKRTVLSWKEEGLIGFTQIGSCVWFGEGDVAELAAKYHHAGKFSKVAPSEFPAQVRQQWREFLGVRSAECGVRNELDEIKAQLAALKKALEQNFGARVDWQIKEEAA